jgi:hypothetical protein
MEGQVTSCVMKFTGANTNVLLVTPRHITRDRFFSSFYEILEENEEVKELRVTIVDIILRILLAICQVFYWLNAILPFECLGNQGGICSCDRNGVLWNRSMLYQGFGHLK